MTNQILSSISSTEAAAWWDSIALGRCEAVEKLPHPLRAALVFIGQLGDQAEARAARIAAESMSAGDNAAATWLVDVCDAIYELRRVERHPDETLH